MKEKERISTMKNSIELSDAQSKVSFKTTNIKTTEKKIVKKESLQNNPSKITSTLQNIINPSSSSRNIKTTISNKESAKIKSIKKSPQSSILSQRSSIQVPFQKPTVNPIKIPVNVFPFFVAFNI